MIHHGYIHLSPVMQDVLGMRSHSVEFTTNKELKALTVVNSLDEESVYYYTKGSK